LSSAVLTKAGEAFADDAFGFRGLPREQWRFFVGRLRVGLLVEQFGQRAEPTPAGSDTENDLLVHGCFDEYLVGARIDD
jgi:hypothetical protein